MHPNTPSEDMADWEKGYGHHEVTVFNMREKCDFKLYRFVNKKYVLTATSNLLDFADGGSQARSEGRCITEPVMPSAGGCRPARPLCALGASCSPRILRFRSQSSELSSFAIIP